MITDICMREANEKVDRATRYMQIKKILKGKEMTAKEIAVEMFRKGYTDSAERNYTAPRLTELEKKYHLVTTVGFKTCQYTNKKVSIYKLVDDTERWEQLRLEWSR